MSIKHNKLFLMLYCLLFLLMYFIFGEIIFYLFQLIFQKIKIPYEISASIVNLIVGITVLIIIKIKKYKINTFSFRELVSGIFIYSLPLQIILVIFFSISITKLYNWYTYNNINQFAAFLILNIFFSITTAFCEEIVFRGAIFNYLIKGFTTLSRNNLFLTCFYSGFIFALVHLFGFITTKYTAVFLIIQFIYALLTGFVFAVIYYKTKSIFSVIFVHAFNDLTVCCYTKMINLNLSVKLNFTLIQLFAITLCAIICIVILLKDKTYINCNTEIDINKINITY